MIHGDTTSVNKIDLDILKKDKNNEKREDQLQTLFVCTEEQNMEHEGKKIIKAYFQAIRQGSIIKKAFLYFLNEELQIENKPIILIQDRTDVYWKQEIGEIGKLYFKNIEDLKRVFPHFFTHKVQEVKEQLQRIAKDDNHPYLSFDLDWDTLKADMPKTKLARINALLKEGCLEIFTKNGDSRKRNAYLQYAKKYRPKIFKDGKLVVCKVADLDSIYYAMRESYYTTEIGGEQRVAAVFEKNNTKD
ncbi:hypothetical protein NHP190012_09820 [Helicobacter sp. NHP19-012]|uniref:Uncharacterized protein n=1 Tax=Helicobacter gastrofelis TaxID=2849642 RepID=A0ABM7SMG8_9HELI|nr:hypothetical protein [Helicobacter sp. NHP19-012]BCZ19340.1 hypothetical protein NHP190012_09820 [Helicobacter sp. NHP19-012]